jgi:signal transduction histidine kinase
MTAAPEVPAGLRPARTPDNPLSLEALDTAVARSAAGFGVAFLLQSIPVMVTQLPNQAGWWTIGALVLLCGGLLVAVVASVLRRAVRAAHSAFAIAYAVALITWPFAVLETSRTPSTSFFLYFSLTIATASATIGFGARAGTAYVVLAPAAYAIIRVTPQGGGVTPLQAVLDSVYSIILGGVITIIIIVLRRAAITVDGAQSTALERYSHAVRQHAVEAERVQVDAIVHDSVLTTLLSAARAETPEAKELAARMAANAIGHLRDAAAVGPDTEGEVRSTVVASRIADAIGTLSGPFEVRRGDLGTASMPMAAAEAMYAAAVQAMVNSLQHGRADHRWVALERSGRGLRVEIGDDGQGFDPRDVPTERLGVRVSIVERVASAGGLAVVDSSPGGGTRVTLRWPAPEHAGAEAAS